MIIFRKPAALKEFLDQRRAKHQLGFIPTMGALHPGHLFLMETAFKANTLRVCSIFVNPTQFNDPEDFRKYPITLDKDILLVEKSGCDILFLPSVEDIYPAGTSGLRHYELGFLETILEGKFRPGHFQGVCQIVHRLLEIVLPDNLYLGQKDYQQCMVIRKLIELIGQDEKIKLKICPTVREPDGLAMSSRNTRIPETDRQKATTISEALHFIQENIQAGATGMIEEKAKEMLLRQGFRVDYVEIANAQTLELINEWDGQQKIVAVAAAFLGDVRLIDNMLINP